MESFLLKVSSVLITFFSVGSNISPAVTSPSPLAPKPVVTQPAKVSNIATLPVLVGADSEKIASYTKDGYPAPISKNANESIGWQQENAVSLKQAISNSLASAKDIKKFCKTSIDNFCHPNPLTILDKNYGFVAQYQDKYLIVWYSRFASEEALRQAKTFIAEFDSLEVLSTMANSLYSSTSTLIPTGHYPDLQLLNLTFFYYYSDGGRECISDTCWNSSALVKNHQVVAFNGKRVEAMGRYGGGSSCVIIESQAILLCNTYASGSNRLTGQESFWLK